MWLALTQDKHKEPVQQKKEASRTNNKKICPNSLFLLLLASQTLFARFSLCFIRFWFHLVYDFHLEQRRQNTLASRGAQQKKRCDPKTKSAHKYTLALKKTNNNNPTLSYSRSHSAPSAMNECLSVCLSFFARHVLVFRRHCTQWVHCLPYFADFTDDSMYSFELLFALLLLLEIVFAAC